MNEEQQFKQQALLAGMAALNAEFRTQIERRDIEGYQEAVLQLLLNVDETWRAKNEKSFFEKALDQIDNGFGAVGEKLGHDNISGHEMVKDWSNATLDDVPADWIPEKGGEYWFTAGKDVLKSIYTIYDNRRILLLSGPLFPTQRLAQMYLDSKKNGEMPDSQNSIFDKYRKDFVSKPQAEMLYRMSEDSQKPVERWKPVKGETYWFVSDMGFTDSILWDGGHVDKAYFDFGNCFPTEPEALAAKERVKKALLG